MTIQTFTAGQKLTALQMNTLQASDFNYTRNVRTEAAYTFTLSDKGKLVESTFATAATFTIPTNASEAFAIGDRIDVLLASDGSVTIAGAVGVTVYAESDLLTISSKWTKVTLIKRATDSWVVTGGGISVQTVEIDNLAVTTAKIDNLAVTTGKIADDAVNGDKIADSSVTSAHIVDGTIVNTDINASAAISLSKLATGTQGTVVIHNSSGVPTATALSGDITVTNAGVTAIGSGKVTSDMIVDGTIVNADINASAAIVDTKLATISTAGKVSNSATTATSSNTASAIVARDASGNFVAGKATLSTGDITTVIENASIVAAASTGTINIDFSTNPTVFYTSDATNDWTINIRGTSTVTLNNTISTGQIATVTFLATIGATQKRPTVFQVDGSPVTPKWMGGTAPTSGNASSIDAYTLAVLKTGNAAFTVFASQSRFA
jgi:hypothetical protein